MTPIRIDRRTSLPAIAAAMLVGIVLLCGPAAGVARAGTPPAGAPKVQFVGNATVPAEQLLAAISEHPLFDATGAIDQDVLERDLLVLAALYWDRGHALVKIGEPVIPPSRDAVTFSIEEGPVFTLAGVTVTGDLIGSAKSNLRLVQSRPGTRFSRSQVANDREALGDFYQDHGYAYASVVPLTKIDIARQTIGLTFEVTRGKRATIERIEIDGSSKTPAHTIRRAMRIAEGDPFTNMELVDGKRRLLALGLEAVVISTRRGSSDELVVVTIEVRE